MKFREFGTVSITNFVENIERFIHYIMTQRHEKAMSCERNNPVKFNNL